MGDFERTVREFKRTLTGGRQKTAPLDIMGKVTRVEDGVAWVRFAGSEVGDTPVRMNIDCKEGDDVQVRSSGGKAWIVGNQSAPPTDDSKAEEVEKKTEKFAERIKSVEKVAGDAEEIANAVNQKVWSDEAGLHIADGKQDAAAERNSIWNSLGMLFRRGLNPILGILTGNNPRVVVYDGNGSDPQNEVASFGSTAVVGQALNGKTRTVTASDGVDLLRRENGSDVTLAHFGYDYGTPEQPGQPQVENPYYTFGYRLPNYDVGNWSVAEGYRTVASGFASHAEGHYTVASGLGSHAEGSQTVASHNYSHAEGYLTVASGPSSHAEGGHTVASDYAHAEGWRTIAHDNCHVEGQYNIEDANSKYAHIIGNGTSEGARSNALAVDWDGNVKAKGDIYVNCDADSSGTAHIGQVFNWQGNLKSNLTTNVDAYVESNGTITLPGGHTYAVFAHIAMTNSTTGATNRRLQIFNKTANVSIITESVFVAGSRWGTLSTVHMWYIKNDITLCFRGAADRPTTTIPDGWIRAVCIA